MTFEEQTKCLLFKKTAKRRLGNIWENKAYLHGELTYFSEVGMFEDDFPFFQGENQLANPKVSSLDGAVTMKSFFSS